jgi:thioredoxin reductase
MTDFEVVIVGGGPAGLSAAMVLGRCRRRVVLFDAGSYRNQRARHVHGFLGLDGIAPTELRRRARDQLAPYWTVEVRDQRVTAARVASRGFTVDVAGAGSVTCRKILIATGIVDHVPPTPGAAELVGDGLYQCPYCDGWEVRDQPLAVYERVGAVACLLTQWSRDVVLCTDGPADLRDEVRQRLARRGVAVESRPIRAFERREGGVRIVFREGRPLDRRAIFSHVGSRPGSDLVQQLGCTTDDGGGVVVDRCARTSVDGVFVAGDASRDVLLAVVAAGEGAAAAVAINRALDGEA